MKILFAFPTNRQELIKEVQKGMSPDNLLYGFNHIEGHETALGDINSHIERILDLIFYPLHRLFFRQIDIDFKLGRALQLRQKINQSDVVVSNIDGISLAICFLKKLRLINKPVVYAVGLYYIQGQLEQTLKSGGNSLFLRFYKWILSGADALIYHADIEKEKLVGLNLFDPAKVSFIAVGSDSKYFKQKKGKVTKNLIVSTGKDRARDYATLLKAAAQLPQLQFVLVCRKENISNLEIPKNVKLQIDVPYKKIQELYRKCKILVIPIKEMNRSSGQMTLTDGMQAQIPVVISDVVGIKHYNLKNRINALIVLPGNSNSLKNAIATLASDDRLRSRIIKNMVKMSQVYTTKNYAEELNRIINWTADDFNLIPINSNHLRYLREIRNSNNKYFLTSTKISKPDQENWYANYQIKHQQNLEFMYLLSYKEQPVGSGAIYNIDYKKSSAEIGRFIIESKYRGLGYGSILLQKILQVANRLNLQSISLEVLSENQTAVDLYKSHGFRKVKIYAKNGKKIIVMKLDKD